jgi:hypothetical protein
VRSHRMLWLVAALVAGLVQLAFACDEDKKGIEQPPSGKAQAEDQTVLLSVVITNHGFVRDARVVSGPATLQQSALRLVNRKRYKGKAIEQWGTAPAGSSARQVLLAVTFAKQKGVPPKIEQAVPAGVSGCVYASRVRVSPEVMECYLRDRTEPVYPAETQSTKDPFTLRLVIDKEGNVRKAEKISGPERLVSAAVEAVTKWKYKPYLLNGEPVDVDTTVDFPAKALSCEGMLSEHPFGTSPLPSWLFNTRPVMPVPAAQDISK